MQQRHLAIGVNGRFGLRFRVAHRQGRKAAVPEDAGAVHLIDIDKIGHPGRLVGEFLEHQRGERAVDIRFAGGRHALFIHHRHRPAGGAAIFRKGLRPAAHGEALRLGVAADVVERAKDAERAVKLRLIDGVETRERLACATLHALGARFRDRLRTFEKLGERHAVHRDAGEALQLALVELAGVKARRVLADDADRRAAHFFKRRRAGGRVRRDARRL